MAWKLCGVLTQSWNKMTKQKRTEMQKEKTILFIFQIETWKPQKKKLFLYFFQKQWYAMQSRLKN